MTCAITSGLGLMTCRQDYVCQFHKVLPTLFLDFFIITTLGVRVCDLRFRAQVLRTVDSSAFHGLSNVLWILLS